MNSLTLRLSIIIPFFNVEKYIAECLDSVYSQDIPESAYEVICVNDCSPDNSCQIVLDYQRKHPNLILVEHETNKMLGAARNTGLRAARGEYVWFIDSDDSIEKNVFGKLLGIAGNGNLEILHFNTQRVNNNGNLSEYLYFPLNTEIISGIDYLKNEITSYWKMSVTAWCKLFKRSFLLENNLYYPEGVYQEDNLHFLKSTILCTRFQFITDYIYFYRENEKSIMNTNLYGGIKLADKIRYCVECISFLDENIQPKETILWNNMVSMYLYHIKSLLKINVYLSNKERYVFFQRIKGFDRSCLKNHLNIKENFIYIYPNLSLLFLSFIVPVLRPIRKLKKLIEV